MPHYRKRKILVLYAGGTIGMKREGDSSPWRPGDLNSMRENIPALAELPYEIIYKEVGVDGQVIDSSDANFNWYNRLVREIGEEQENYDGFVVVLGTDTMGPTAGYLSYMLEGLARPVVITGSMRPAVEANSDGPRNLLASIKIAAEAGVTLPPINEVLVCLGGRIIRGTSCYKYSNREFDAMRSADQPDLGHVALNCEIEFDAARLLPAAQAAFIPHQLSGEPLVAPLMLVPGISEKSFQETLQFMVDSGYAIMFFGAELTPTDSRLTLARKIIPKGWPVFFLDQSDCPDPNWFKLSGMSDVQQALAKTHYILSLTDDREAIRKFCAGSLRGENDAPLVREAEVLRLAESETEERNFSPR
jgi:L-asparaginase